MYKAQYELKLEYFHDYEYGYELKCEGFESFEDMSNYINEDKAALHNLCTRYKNKGYSIAIYVLDKELTERANLILEKALLEQENTVVHQIRLQKDIAEQEKEAQERKLYEALKQKYEK